MISKAKFVKTQKVITGITIPSTRFLSISRLSQVSFDRKFSWFYRTVGRSLKGGAGRLLMCPFRGLDALGRGTKGFCKWVLDRPFLSFGTTTLAGKGLSKIGDTEMRIPFTDVGLGMRPSDVSLTSGVKRILGDQPSFV